MDRDKAIGQHRLAVAGVLSVFDIYGMGTHISEATNQLEVLAMQLHERLSGNDVPIGVRHRKKGA